jgi:hypothetical protein
MKGLLTLIVAFIMVVAFAGVTPAGMWDKKCKMCHKEGNKMKASTKAQLLEKHKTADSMIKAAKASKSPMMKAYKKDDVLNEAAKDLY